MTFYLQYNHSLNLDPGHLSKLLYWKLQGRKLLLYLVTLKLVKELNATYCLHHDEIMEMKSR